MIVFGLVFGRWWRWSILAGGIVWAAVLFATRSMESSPSTSASFDAIFFGIANTAVGVGLFMLGRLASRVFRPIGHSAPTR
jgi:hypothetical protein